MDAIKKLVSGRLKAQAAGAHPDPELLAAFAENGLSGRDRDGMLIHLSACTDCREVLYLALPDPAEAQQVEQSTTRDVGEPVDGDIRAQQLHHGADVDHGRDG